jgi:hypothetical protein
VEERREEADERDEERRCEEVGIEESEGMSSLSLAWDLWAETCQYECR